MKALKGVFSITVLALLLGATPSFSGDRVGNGGGSLVCRDPLNTVNVLEARLFDFSEANFNYGFMLAPPAGTLEDMLVRVAEDIGALYPDVRIAFESELGVVKRIMQVKPVQLTIINDARYIYLPDACQTVSQRPVYEQTANYLDDKNELIVAKSVYEALPEQDKAGLLAHEAIYRIYRKLGDEDSVRARKLNALAFSLRDEAKQAEFKSMLDTIDDYLFRQPTAKKWREFHTSIARTCDLSGVFSQEGRTVDFGYFKRVLQMEDLNTFVEYDIHTGNKVAGAIDYKGRMGYFRQMFVELDRNTVLPGPMNDEADWDDDYAYAYARINRSGQITKRFAPTGNSLSYAYASEFGDRIVQWHSILAFPEHLTALMRRIMMNREIDCPNYLDSLLSTHLVDVNVRAPGTNYAAIHYAAAIGDLPGQFDILERLLAMPELDVNVRTAKGYTPLMVAMLFNNPKTVERLLGDKRVFVDEREIAEFLSQKQPVAVGKKKETVAVDIIPDARNMASLLKKVRRLEIKLQK